MSPENGLYNLVCNHCANEVSRWYIFKQQVVRSFEVAQWLLNRNSRNTDISDLSNASYKCSVNQDEESLSSIIEDPDELEKLLNEYAPEVININCNTNQTTNIKSVVDIINSIALNLENNTGVTISTSTVTTGPKRKKDSQELLCRECGKQCKSTNSYNRHLKTHDTSRPFICCKCDKTFKTSQVLAEHMKRHYDDRRHKCALCGQKFYAKSSLKDHIRSHTGERPFKCEICGRTFATKAILRQHMVVCNHFIILFILSEFLYCRCTQLETNNFSVIFAVSFC